MTHLTSCIHPHTHMWSVREWDIPRHIRGSSSWSGHHPLRDNTWQHLQLLTHQARGDDCNTSCGDFTIHSVQTYRSSKGVFGLSARRKVMWRVLLPVKYPPLTCVEAAFVHLKLTWAAHTQTHRMETLHQPQVSNGRSLVGEWRLCCSTVTSLCVWIAQYVYSWSTIVCKYDKICL